MTRYLITGAAGFIGRRLSEYLSSQGHEVSALLHKPVKGPWNRSFSCNLGFEPLPKGLLDGVIGIFHLANIAHTELIGVEAQRYKQVNVGGTEALLQAAVNAGVERFVYFSSVRAVKVPDGKCVDEKWNHLPVDSYGHSKREAEKRVLTVGAQSRMHVCNLRPALTYGPGVKGNLSLMLHAVEQGSFPPLPEFGSRRSMVSLDDLISAAWLAMDNPCANGNTYFVADGESYSSRRLYEEISEALEKPIPRWYIPERIIRFGAVMGDGLEWLLRRKMPLNSSILSKLSTSACFQSNRIQNELGWKPRQTFFDVLPKMVKEMHELTFNGNSEDG